MADVTLGTTPVGSDHPPVFLAEIGTLFNQDLALAQRMVQRIRAAREAAVVPIVLKGEILHTADICGDDDAVEVYHSKAGERREERYRDLIERKVVPLSHYEAIFGLCPDLPFCVSVYDFEGADFAVGAGAVALKVASSNITHVPLLRHVACTGLPVIVDTGRATLADVERAVATVRGAGGERLVLEHSPDGHPALAANHNLRMLQTLARAFDVPVGLSDHYDGEQMLYLSLAYGAALVEKGLVLDATGLAQAVSHAMRLDDLEEVAQRLHDCWMAGGSGMRDLDRPIGKLGTSARMGLVAAHDLRPGDPVDLDHVTFAFPRRGIGVEHWDEVEGWELVEPVAAGAVIDWPQVRPAGAPPI